MSRFGNRLGSVALSVILSCFAVQTAETAEVAPDLKRKINIAGKQRMLSQRMARAVCFSSRDVMARQNDDIARLAEAAFDSALDGLRNGDGDLGIRREANAAVLAELDRVDALWPDYMVALQAVADDPSRLGEVAVRSLDILTAANDVVLALEASAIGSTVSEELARMINIAGRQRMLTQRAAKEYCLIAAGIDVPAQRAALARTVALFDQSLNGLLEGDDDMGLLAAPDEIIQLQLEYVRDLWMPVRSQLQRVIDGLPVNDIGLQTVAANIDSVLKAADEAVWLYENI
ncbi:type IV pili methyl-accepting chemotaxis transducer N-terminal domain-containing protein [Marinibacterium sp. SX1]|uniref:type IV pili methyl-accepting chemotaxis transducer N-terminal domain-containing protein n=1 Tax=Marinibacterium sp. SX1 TaxID=3388424 RepID=UPI003D16938D